jgi:hypothetical protein
VLLCERTPLRWISRGDLGFMTPIVPYRCSGQRLHFHACPVRRRSRNRWFADSALEGNGFELSVPRRGGNESRSGNRNRHGGETTARPFRPHASSR